MDNILALALVLIPALWGVAYAAARQTKNEKWVRRLEFERKIWRAALKIFGRTPIVVLLVFTLVSGGCVGARNGGSSYRLNWKTDKGEIINFTGDRATDETNLDSTVTVNKDGTLTVSHKELSKQGTADPLLIGVGELLKALAPLVEKLTPLLEKTAAGGV